MDMKMTFSSTLNILLFFCTTFSHAVVFENHADHWITIKIGSPKNHDLMLFVLDEKETLKQDYLPSETVLKVKYHDHTTQYQFAAKDAPKSILKIINQNGKAVIPLLDAYKTSSKGATEAERKSSASKEVKDSASKS